MSARKLGGVGGAARRSRGGGKAAPYGRKPTGRGTAARPQPRTRSQAGPRRYAAAVTAHTQG